MLRLSIRDDDPTGDPFLTVYGPDGPLASTESAAETAALDPIVIEGDSPYVVIVSWNGKTPGGSYELLLDRSQVTLMTPGQPAAGLLTADEGGQRHYFYAEADSTATLTLTTEDAIAPALSVATLDGTTALFTSEGAATRSLSVTLAVPTTGVYLVQVRDSAGLGETGAYTLTLEQPGEHPSAKARTAPSRSARPLRPSIVSNVHADLDSRGTPSLPCLAPRGSSSCGA